MEKLPARLGDTRDLSTVRQLTETDAAEAEHAHESMVAATAPAAVDLTRGKLGFSARLCDLCFSSHRVERLNLEWETKSFKQEQTICLGSCICRDRDLQSVHTLDFVWADFRE